MHSPTPRHVAGFFLSLTAAIMWGVLPLAIKELLAEMDATTIVWYRFLVAGLALFTWLAYSRQLPAIIQKGSQVRYFLLLAAAGLCCNYFLFSYSLNFVNGETTEVVIQLTTLFLILGGVIIYKEPFFALQKLGTSLIVVGLLLFFNDRLAEFDSFDNREAIGVLVLLFAAITWTVYALLQKQLLASFSSAQILFLIYLFSALVLLPFISPSSLFQLTGFQLFLLLFCCMNTLVAYGCFAEALNCWDASKVSAVLALAPIFTIGGLKLVVLVSPDYPFSDRLSFLSLTGAVLLIIGSVCIALLPILKRPRYADLADAPSVDA
ncbi:MAG: DMT family transporter [Pseudohongiella sp.]|nr:DMT family transporter [Pseudohongiella sp.]